MKERIMYFLEDLDVRRQLGQPPRKLKMTNFVMPEKYNFFYFVHKKKLLKICQDCHVDVLSPVDLSLTTNNFYIFNLECDEYTYEYYSSDGVVVVDPSYTAPIVARGPIKFIDK